MKKIIGILVLALILAVSASSVLVAAAVPCWQAEIFCKHTLGGFYDEESPADTPSIGWWECVYPLTSFPYWGYARGECSADPPMIL